MTFKGTYLHSQLTADSAAALVAAHYALGGEVHCKFYTFGLHDNYLVKSAGARYILRVYRNDWRSVDRVQFELALLSFLQEHGAPVAGPVRTTTEQLMCRISSPEGERQAAVFHYAKGCAPAESITADECTLLGHAVARMHDLAAPFEGPVPPPILDVPYLLDDSVTAIAPFLDHVEFKTLDELRDKLHHVLPELPKENGVYGICTGDVNPRNFHIDQSGQITLFDFDQCGYGFRAFEIAKFASSIHASKNKSALIAAFLGGYQEVRRLGTTELAAIPWFEMIAVIWVMAINAQNANRIGHKHLEKPFWDRRIAVLRELEAQANPL